MSDPDLGGSAWTAGSVWRCAVPDPHSHVNPDITDAIPAFLTVVNIRISGSHSMLLMVPANFKL